MKPAARLAAAIDILEDMQNTRTPVDRVLKAWARNNRYAGSKDRRAINERVYDCVRHAHLFAGRMGSDTARGLVLASLVQEGLSADEITALFDGERFSPAPLDTDELARLTDPAPLNDAARCNLPVALLPRLESAFGEELMIALDALNQRAPTDLRVNTLKGDVEQAKVALQEAQIETVPVDGADLALRMIGDHDILQLDAYRKGLIEVQDAGSQIVTALCDAKPGEQVIDFCAGAGGKSLALAAMMDNKGQIYAHDADKRRLGRITARLERAGVRNVQKVDSAEKLPPTDCVLLDVPCSGTGAWRRNPETRWRFSEDWFSDLLQTQALLLKQGAALVKPGGRLCYVTCSVIPDENRLQIDQFLAETSGFVLDHEAQLTPHRTGTDGFYFARLVKQG